MALNSSMTNRNKEKSGGIAGVGFRGFLFRSHRLRCSCVVVRSQAIGGVVVCVVSRDEPTVRDRLRRASHLLPRGSGCGKYSPFSSGWNGDSWYCGDCTSTLGWMAEGCLEGDLTDRGTEDMMGSRTLAYCGA